MANRVGSSCEEHSGEAGEPPQGEEHLPTRSRTEEELQRVSRCPGPRRLKVAGDKAKGISCQSWARVCGGTRCRLWGRPGWARKAMQVRAQTSACTELSGTEGWDPS